MLLVYNEVKHVFDKGNEQNNLLYASLFSKKSTLQQGCSWSTHKNSENDTIETVTSNSLYRICNFTIERGIAADFSLITFLTHFNIKKSFHQHKRLLDYYP